MTTLADIAAITLDGIDREQPVRVTKDTTVMAVVRELENCSAVLVEDQGKLVGVFTERDLMARVDHSDPNWPNGPISDVMTKSPVTIRTDQTLEEALNTMLVNVFRHLPTVTPDGVPEGVVSILDLLVHITEYFPDDFVNLPIDPDHEASGRWGG